ncbi:putative caffeine synthase 4 [Quercus suber]|uniref:Caffeine synthase 4 n=1 Tax=Quercus suber TaxID=58331 RepID=A0AAW0KS85_QUESU
MGQLVNCFKEGATMEIQQVLHMNGGDGKKSYAINSQHQRTVAAMVKPILEESMEELYLTLFPSV